jgi:hypothetical protein
VNLRGDFPPHVTVAGDRGSCTHLILPNRSRNAGVLLWNSGKLPDRSTLSRNGKSLSSQSYVQTREDSLFNSFIFTVLGCWVGAVTTGKLLFSSKRRNSVSAVVLSGETRRKLYPVSWTPGFFNQM